MNSECLDRCDFLRFSGKFSCSYYNEDLSFYSDEQNIIVKRCSECIEDRTIGSNTLEEDILKIKKCMGWMGDIFYSFKDDFENLLTEMYRHIKKLEDNINEKDILTESSREGSV